MKTEKEREGESERERECMCEQDRVENWASGENERVRERSLWWRMQERDGKMKRKREQDG